VVLVVKVALLFQASTILRLLHEVRDVASLKILRLGGPKSVTLEMSHESSPTPANFDARAKRLDSAVTLPTFHALRSAFISLAPKKVPLRVVMETVSQESKPMPANFDLPSL
jgi:hypothetical protein